MALNVSTVNGALPSDPDWQGRWFEDTIGFWAAALGDTDMRFDSDGKLTRFDHDERTSYDRSDRLTVRFETEVPAPGTLTLLIGGLLGLAVRRPR